MNYKDFKALETLKEIIETKPAAITATADENGNAQIQVEGRGIDLLFLSMAIAENLIKKTHISVDDYCYMFKDGMNNFGDMSEKSIENEIEKMREKLFGRGNK